MTQPLENSSASANLSDILDMVAGVGLVGGTVASLLTQQVALAAFPFAVSLGLNMFNRRRLTNDLIASQQASIAQLTQQVNQHQGTLGEQLQQFQRQLHSQLEQQSQNQQEQSNQFNNKVENIQQIIADLGQESEQAKEQINRLEQQANSLEIMVNEVRQIANASQSLNSNPNQADFYYQRGLSHERLGDIAEAIADYTEVIRLDAAHAQAYHHRGLLEAELGHNKKAAEDLRMAAKCYFDLRDLDSYEQMRELSKKFYDVRPALSKMEVLEPLDENHIETPEEPLFASSLFA